MQLRLHVTNRTTSHAGLDTSLKTRVASVWGVRALPRIARQTLEDVVGIVPTTVLSADCQGTYRRNKIINPKRQCVMYETVWGLNLCEGKGEDWLVVFGFLLCTVQSVCKKRVLA